MTFDQAQEAFLANKTRATAGAFLSAAIEYEADDMIGDDTFLDAIGMVCEFLNETPAANADVAVFPSQLDGPDHPLPFIVLWPSGVALYSNNEEAACAVQREWRRAVGLDEMTGQPANTAPMPEAV